MKRIFQVLGVVLAFVLGGFLMYWYTALHHQAVEKADVVLEQIRAVTKLTTVEGQFSEIYDYSNYKGDFPLLWDKKALIRVQAKVSVGYDLEDMQVDVDEVNQTLYIRQLPKARILSIDHQLSYYNIQEGLFSSFSTADHNLMQAQAKQFIREKAEQSTLMDRAEKEGQESLEIMDFMLRGMGWKLVVEAADSDWNS